MKELFAHCHLVVNNCKARLLGPIKSIPILSDLGVWSFVLFHFSVNYYIKNVPVMSIALGLLSVCACHRYLLHIYLSGKVNQVKVNMYSRGRIDFYPLKLCYLVYLFVCGVFFLNFFSCCMFGTIVG